METRTQYPSDVTDEQWRILVKLLPPPKGRGRKPIDRRRVLNAVLYVVRSGCQWRMLPRDFPHCSTVQRSGNASGSWRGSAPRFLPRGDSRPGSSAGRRAWGDGVATR